MDFQTLPLEAFAAEVAATSTEVSSVALGGHVIAVSDEFFAEASNLLKVEPAPSLKGQFGPKGALFSGWETRRHNPDHDWAIIRLGSPSAYITGFDIDTAHFSGNEPPFASVQALSIPLPGDNPTADDVKWVEVLPRVKLGPDSKHFFKILQKKSPYTHVKLNIYPDGGVARFRVYGIVSPIFPPLPESFDLAHVFSGGRVVSISDQHFGAGPNLLLPGRGKDMSDGWETRRSRQPGHTDWAIIMLGAPGILEQTEIDTAHYMGNFPESCELHAINSGEIIPPAEDDGWTSILPRTKLGPHRRHFFQLVNVEGKVYTHVRMTIYPDGGVKRVRLIGKRHDPGRHEPLPNLTNGHPPAHVIPPSTLLEMTSNEVNGVKSTSTPIPALLLTPEAFAPFGHVIQAYADPNSRPKGVAVAYANQGTAFVYKRVAPVVSSYPEGITPEPITAVSVFRSTPAGAQVGGIWDVKLLERHIYTNQIFIPMGTARWPGSEEPSLVPARGYLVVVAQNGNDDKPDLSTLRAFLASTAQGISYTTGIWHHPMITLETAIDFSVIETQIGTPGDIRDCEIVRLDESLAAESIPRVQLPQL